MLLNKTSQQHNNNRGAYQCTTTAAATQPSTDKQWKLPALSRDPLLCPRLRWPRRLGCRPPRCPNRPVLFA